MQSRSFTVTWEEGEGENPETEPATNADGLVRIVVPTSSPDHPAGFSAYVPNDDLQKVNGVLSVWAKLGAPEA